MKEILTPEEAADLLGCSAYTVEQLARKREIPAVKFGAGWVFPREALIEHANYLARHHVTSTPAPAAPARVVYVNPVGQEPQPWWMTPVNQPIVTCGTAAGSTGIAGRD